MKRMRDRRGYMLLCMAALLAVPMLGCSAKGNDGESVPGLTGGARLLARETVSPNEDYVESEADVVTYTVEVSQNSDHSIVVTADSNSVFFDGTQYVLEYDREISETDVAVEWTTLMGNPEPTEEDQLAVAQVSISEDGEIISQRNINFFGEGVEIVADRIAQNQ